MRMNFPKSNSLVTNASSVAVALVVGYALTKGFVISSASQAIFILMGNLSLLLAFFFGILALIQLRTTYQNALIALLILFQVIAAYLMGYGNYEYFLVRYFLYTMQILLILIGVFSSSFSLSVFTAIVTGIYMFSALVLLATGASVGQAADSGNLVSTGTDTLNNYQALAHVFGVNAVIFTIVAFAQGKNSWLRIWLAAVAVVFVVLTFYSGGRGELIAALFIITVVIGRGHIALRLIAVVGVSVFLLNSDFIYDLQESAGYTRILYALEHRDTGLRAELFGEALQQYASGNIFQIFFGQGVNAFQHHYDYIWGLYPHNFLIETLLTSGIFVFLFYLLLYVNVFANLFRARKQSSIWHILFFGIACNFLILTMKSGTISTSGAGVAFLFVAWFREEIRLPMFVFSRRSLAQTNVTVPPGARP